MTGDPSDRAGTSGRHRSSFGSRLSRAWLVLLAAVALLAPFLAGEVPVLVVGKVVDAPALTGTPRAPSGDTWRAWCSSEESKAALVILPIWPRDPQRVDMRLRNRAPDLEHPLGVDASGRDVLARIVWGSRSVVAVALGSVLLAFLLGVPLGLAAGWFRGGVDFLVLRAIEAITALPTMVVAMAAASLLGPSTLGLIVVIGVLGWSRFARVVRGEMLSLREAPFVEAARLRGLGTVSILVRHVLPQLKGQIAVIVGFLAAAAVGAESSLAFLGLGSASTVTWGGLLADGRAQAWSGAWHLWFFPGLVLGLTAVAIHVATDAWSRPGD